MTGPETEPNEVTATIRHVDPRLVAVLRRAAELAGERGHWLGAEHVIAALTEDKPEASLFSRWWPRDGASEPDPYNGYPVAEPGVTLRPIGLEDLTTVAQQMIPPPAQNIPNASKPTVDYAATGPDSPAYRSIIEGSDRDASNGPRRYADYESEPE
ncbi:hypothetical protein IU500_12575 [Nocardia terpenica]|uniref:hypothetical protein n=1 Tax=Nocardia terpenica TaxID=455432 RepID=UPI001893D2A0|nr:hypothetical protein [Nocardia terpenica]MBF6062987.1 hypothetical protein [Nocardia terpenica]MBF6104878.1 hypothetical protein [Nocardia terpenica]MBF6112685.1 hypothetical protein [Nocardia terpenica]MBF6118606.1 hypothetical protein [Nocardia terpenica]MBF6155085.1 hypothetical protein [Nocardia terpenica]